MAAMPSRSLTVFRWTFFTMGIVFAVAHIARIWMVMEPFRYSSFLGPAMMCGGSSYALCM
jgi:hypothetical protein